MLNLKYNFTAGFSASVYLLVRAISHNSNMSDMFELCMQKTLDASCLRKINYYSIFGQGQRFLACW